MTTRKGRFIWSKEAVLALIELYQNHPVLYNSQNANYKNKEKREVALNIIKAELLKLPFCYQQSLDVEDVKIKIHTLRSQFNKEWKKKMVSVYKGSDTAELYEPKLWCFENLMFLKDDEYINTNFFKLERIDVTEAVEELEKNSDSDLLFDATMEDLNMNLTSPTPSTTSTTKSRHEVASYIQNYRRRKERQDDLYRFSRLMEVELSKIKNTSRLRKLKRGIMNSIFEAQEEEEEEKN